MPNLFVSSKCERNCSFCFAKKGPWDASYHAHGMTLDEVKKFVDLKTGSNMREMGLMGGEPLYNPELKSIIEILWDKGYTPKIFTGISCDISDDILNLEIPPYKRLRFVANLGPEDSYTEKQLKVMKTFFTKFSEHISLAHTILKIDEDLSYLIDYVKKYKLLPIIRLGLALPVADGSNDFVNKSDYRAFALKLIDFVEFAAEEGIIIGLDCGFVACMFTIEEIGKLQFRGIEFVFCCKPVIDVGPKLISWYCFPLAADTKIGLNGNDRLDYLENYFSGYSKEKREKLGVGIFEKCSSCDYLTMGLCNGGCLALLINEKKNLLN